jgi:hypothetical protein
VIRSERHFDEMADFLLMWIAPNLGRGIVNQACFSPNRGTSHTCCDVCRVSTNHPKIPCVAARHQLGFTRAK